ncbi:MAG: AsmA family protein, partial [Terriglobales bacterium]
MRKLVIAVAIILALIIAVLVIVPLVVDANQYHGVVQAQLQKALGRPVSFGQMHFSLTPPSLKLDDLKIGESPRFGQGQFATAHSVDVSVKLWPLIHKQVDIRSLSLDQPQVQLIKDAKGVWNFSTLGSSEAAPPSGTAANTTPPATAGNTAKPSAGNAPSSSGSGNTLALGKLAITNGQVTIEDRTTNSRATYNNIDLTLNNFAPGKPFSFDAALHLPGSGNEALKLSGTAGPMADQVTNTPFDGQLEFDQVSIASLEKLSGTSMKGTSGTLTGKMSARNQQGTLAAEGSLRLTDGTINNVKLDYPVTLDFKANDQLQPDRIHIDNASLHLGPTPISIAGDVNAGSTPAQLALKLALKNADIQEVARLASSFGVAVAPGMQVSGGIDADLRANGPANAPALNGTLNASNVRVSGSGLKQPVSVNSLALTMTPDEIRSAPFTATTGGTNLAVQFALSKYTSPSPVIDATIRTANSQLSELLAMARAYGVSAVEGMDGTGTINLDLHAAGPIKNASALQLSGSGKIANASIKTPSLTQPVNVRNADLRFTSNSMTMQNLAASVGHTNATGNMTVQNFSAPRLQFTLHADKVNVAELQQLTATPAPQKRASAFSTGWPTLAGFARVGLSLVPSANAAAPPAPSIVD